MKSRKYAFWSLLAIGLVAVWFLLHRATPIDSPASAIAAARAQLKRTMWSHVSPQVWLSFNQELQSPELLAKVLSAEERQEIRSDPNIDKHCIIFFGAMSSANDVTGDVWAVGVHTNMGGGHYIMLRASDGKILAMYSVQGS